jgi:hypothetical protein
MKNCGEDCGDPIVYGQDYGDEHIINSIDGVVQAAGFKIGVRGWLDMGSMEWSESNEIERSGAYLAAMKSGWTEKALTAIMLRNYKHLDQPSMDLVFSLYGNK